MADLHADREPWEYRVEVFKNPELDRLRNDLNRYGADGWELVSLSTTVKTIINITGNDLVAVFKRRGVGHFSVSTMKDEAGWGG